MRAFRSAAELWGKWGRCLLALPLCAAQAPSAPPGAPASREECHEEHVDRIAAFVDGTPITLAEIDAEVGDAADVLRDTLRAARSRELERAVDTVLLRRRASALGIEVAELLQREVVARTTHPTVADARALYDARKAEFPGGFAAHRTRILEQLAAERRTRESARFLERLRGEEPALGLAQGIDLADTSISSSTALAEVAGARITLREVDEGLQPLPALVEEEIYELRRQAIERRVERLSQASPRARREVEILIGAPRAADPRLACAEQPVRGAEDAPVTVVAFLDFECSNCALVHETLVELCDALPGVARLTLRDFPLSIHEQALSAALAAEAAREQGRYWEYAALLFANQPVLGSEDFHRHARALGLDAERFAAALRSDHLRERIEKDRRDGIALGVYSTPTVFVNGRRVVERSREDFERAILEAVERR